MRDVWGTQKYQAGPAAPFISLVTTSKSQQLSGPHLLHLYNSMYKRLLPGLIFYGFNQVLNNLLSEWIYKMNEKTNNWFCLPDALPCDRQGFADDYYHLSFCFLEHNRLHLSRRDVKTSANTDQVQGGWWGAVEMLFRLSLVGLFWCDSRGLNSTKSWLTVYLSSVYVFIAYKVGKYFRL